MDIVPQDNTPYKLCSNPDCETPWLPATPKFFYGDNSKKDRLRGKCKTCDKAGRRARYHPRTSRRKRPQDENFWSKVDKTGECWLWTTPLDRKGYGRFHTCYGTGRPHHLGAHRMAYILTYGDISNDLEVCHSCDNPPCVRPDHLFLGTHAENMADQYAKGRNSPPPRNDGDAHWTRQQPDKVKRGERHPIAKLTFEQVRTIRASYASGNYTLSQLGRQYGVNKTSISKIVNNHVWKGA